MRPFLVFTFILTLAALLAQGQCPTAYDSSRVRKLAVDYLARGSTRKGIRKTLAKRIVAVVPVFKAEQRGFHNNEVDTTFSNSFSPETDLIAVLIKNDSIECVFVALYPNGTACLDCYPNIYMPEWQKAEAKLRSSGKFFFLCSTFHSFCYFEKGKLMIYNRRGKKYTRFEEYHPEENEINDIRRR